MALLCCAAGIDLDITRFELRPKFNRLIVSEASSSTDVNGQFEYEFDFKVRKGPSSTAVAPTEFKYKLVIADSSTLTVYDDVPSSENTHTDMATETVGKLMNKHSVYFNYILCKIHIKVTLYNLILLAIHSW